MSNGAYKFSPKVLLRYRIDRVAKPMPAKTGVIAVETAVASVTIWLTSSLLKEMSKLVR